VKGETRERKTDNEMRKQMREMMSSISLANLHENDIQDNVTITASGKNVKYILQAFFPYSPGAMPDVHVVCVQSWVNLERRN